ncbi:MAG: sigma-70 family RNA polymerase sigma factor [Actinomycetota bacterium]
MDDVERCVEAARKGDPQAWQRLVDGHAGLVWSVIRGFRFDTETGKDVFQTVWLRLAEHLDNIREPAKIAGWIGQTTRNECVGLVRQRTKVVVSDEVADLPEANDRATTHFPDPGAGLERSEEREAVAEAFDRLGERCQRLLRLLILDPPLSYEQISEQLELPVGSIGPTRSRCLDTLRNSPQISRITGGGRPS